VVESRAIVLPFSEQRDSLAEPEPEPDLRVQPDNRVRVGKAFGREAGKEDPWSRGDIGLEQSRLIPQDDVQGSPGENPIGGPWERADVDPADGPVLLLEMRGSIEELGFHAEPLHRVKEIAYLCTVYHGSLQREVISAEGGTPPRLDFVSLRSLGMFAPTKSQRYTILIVQDVQAESGRAPTL